MEAEAFLELFDSHWFEREILKKQPNLTSFSGFDQNPDRQIEIGAEKMGFNVVPSTISRSMSDDLWAKSSFGSGYPMSPDSVLTTPKLQTILSGKEISDEEGKIGNSTNSNPIQIFTQDAAKKRGKIRRKKKLSKSLSELEFEEVKGFMDLGFVFSEEDKDDSSLVSIIPGLQRLGKKESESENENETVARPYLSEAWEALDKKKKQGPLMNWRIPSVTNEIDMKDNLKFWAKTIASAVR